MIRLCATHLLEGNLDKLESQKPEPEKPLTIMKPSGPCCEDTPRICSVLLSACFCLKDGLFGDRTAFWQSQAHTVRKQQTNVFKTSMPKMLYGPQKNPKTFVFC